MGNYHVPFWRAVEGATPSLTLIIRTEGIRILSNDGGNPVIAESRRSKTKKPQGEKASVDETGSPDCTCTQVGVG